MSDYRLNINPGNQLSATCFQAGRVVKESILTCYHQTLGKKNFVIVNRGGNYADSKQDWK